jgi:hypothetical protein
MQLTLILLTFIISLSLASPVAEPEPLALAEPEPLALANPEPLALAEPESLALANPEPLALANPEALPIAEPEPQGDRNRPGNDMRCRNSRRVRARSCPGCGDQGWYSRDQWHRMQCYTQRNGYAVFSFDDGGGLRAKDWGDENDANK